MSTLTQGKFAGEGIFSEANGRRSRDLATVLSGQNLGAMAVLGKVLTGTAAAAANGGNTGNGTSSAVTVAASGQPGAYSVTFRAATKFDVFDPSGNYVGSGTTGVAFNNQIGFTITAGGTAFVVGDGFTMTVAAGSGKYVQCAVANTDGSQTAVAVLINPCNATGGDKTNQVILARSCELNQSELDFGTMNAGQITTAIAQLALQGIIVRSAI